MFTNETSVFQSEGIFNKDKTHRYLLTKQWNKDKKTITVVTKHPNYDGVYINDLTTHLICNELAKMDYGTIHFVNLFSKIRTVGTTGTMKNDFDKHTDIHMIKAIKASDDVLIAWGSIDSYPAYQKRIKSVVKQIKETKKPLLALINPLTDKITHPLSPIARSGWTIKKYK